VFQREETSNPKVSGTAPTQLEETQQEETSSSAQTNKREPIFDPFIIIILIIFIV